MCAGCSGGRTVSATTARLNAHRLKPAVRQALQERVGRRAGIGVFGDRWVLRFPTGRQEVFDDVEALTAALSARGLVDPAGAAAPSDEAGALVHALLLRPAPAGSG